MQGENKQCVTLSEIPPGKKRLRLFGAHVQLTENMIALLSN